MKVEQLLSMQHAAITYKITKSMEKSMSFQPADHNQPRLFKPMVDRSSKPKSSAG